MFIVVLFMHVTALTFDGDEDRGREGGTVVTVRWGQVQSDICSGRSNAQVIRRM